MKYIFLFVFLPGFVAISCHSTLSPVEYVAWVQAYTNGLHQEKQVGVYVLDVQYKPAAFVRLTENNPTADSSMVYINLKLKITDSQTPDILKYHLTSEKEYYDRMYYYSFGLKKDIYLMDGTEKIACGLFHFERSHDVGGYRMFVLGFPRKTVPSVETDKTLVIDSPYLPAGIIKIRIPATALQAVPEVY